MVDTVQSKSSNEATSWAVFMHMLSVLLGACFLRDEIGFLKIIGAALLGDFIILIMVALIMVYFEAADHDAVRDSSLPKSKDIVNCIVSNVTLICIFAVLIACAEVWACHLLISIGDKVTQNIPIFAFLIKGTAAIASMIPWIILSVYTDFIFHWQNWPENEFIKPQMAFTLMVLNIPCIMSEMAFGLTMLSSEFSASTVKATVSMVGTVAFRYMCVAMVIITIAYVFSRLCSDEEDSKHSREERINVEIKSLQRLIDCKELERGRLAQGQNMV